MRLNAPSDPSGSMSPFASSAIKLKRVLVSKQRSNVCATAGGSEFELLLSFDSHSMPTRSRTKSTSKDLLHSKTLRSKEKSTRIDDTVSDIEKENRSRTVRSRSKAQTKPTNDAGHAKNDTYCLCNQPDDGSPMVCCSECHEWCVLSPATLQFPHGSIPFD